MNGAVDDAGTPLLHSVLKTPIGPLLLVSRGERLVRIEFPSGRTLTGRAPSPPAGSRRDDTTLTVVREQVEQYFAGERQRFDLPLLLEGTPFQKKVWNALRGIGFGQTRSYGEMAAFIGEPTASRAVGAANGRNPIPLVVPCHRVIGADGSLTGFGGGLPRKQ